MAGESVGSPMGRDEQGRRQPYAARRTRALAAHEVPRAGTGLTTGAATSERVLEASAATQKVMSLPSEDGGVVQHEHRRLADDGGAVGAGVGSLPAMGVEEVAVECTANLERKCGRAAACIVTPVRGHLVDGFVKGKNFGGFAEADNVMSNPKVCWAGAAAAP